MGSSDNAGADSEPFETAKPTDDKGKKRPDQIVESHHRLDPNCWGQYQPGKPSGAAAKDKGKPTGKTSEANDELDDDDPFADVPVDEDDLDAFYDEEDLDGLDDLDAGLEEDI